MRVSANTRTETLADMAKHAKAVAAQCDCGHVGIVDLQKLLRLFWVRRWDTRVHMAVDHLRCTACGARPYRLRMTHQLPTGPDWGPRTEEDWKRLVARLRG